MSKTVMVTGANGHLGYNLCKRLSDKGYKIKAGVRNKNDHTKNKHLLDLENVELVQADIMQIDQSKFLTIENYKILCQAVHIDKNSGRQSTDFNRDISWPHGITAMHDKPLKTP